MINKRIFGADIPVLVKKKLEARQKVAQGNKLPNQSIIDSKYKDSRKSYYKYDELINSDFEMEADLSSRTPFARMWTAVALVRPLDVNMDELSSTEYSKLTDDEKKGYKTITHKIYALGTNNLSTVDNVQNPNQSLDDVSELNYAIFPRELGQKQIGDVTIEGNKFLKPQAGIISLSSETGGTLGSIKTTEVKFIVHNFTDYDQIYNKYFLRPGAQIFLDFGWSSLKTPLYNPSELLKDDDGIGVEKKLYGEKELGDVPKDGYVTEQAGDQETLIGIVTSYDSKIMENGSVECSITLTSKNSALNLSPKLPSESIQTTNAKFEFDIDNLIKFEAIYRLANRDTRTNIMNALKKANPSGATKEKAAFEQYIDELAYSSFGGQGDFNPTTLAMESGVFLVGDDAVTSDQYLSWGLLEDEILNKYFGHGDTKEKVNDGENLEIGINSSKSFTIYHSSFNMTQQRVDIAPNFVVPPYWDRTWQSDLKSSGKGKAGKNLEERKYDFVNSSLPDEQKSPEEFDTMVENVINDIDSFIENIDIDNGQTQYFAKKPSSKTPISKFDADRFRVPIREIFVNVDIVKKAFLNDNNTTFKAVVNEIIDAVNEESYGIWNWILASDGDSNKLSVIDTNQLGIAEAKEENRFEKTFMFNVMSKDSIVKNYDVSFEMPDGEIGSMYAIQDMSGTSKKLYPISTLIEEQATLQSLLSKVGEESGKLRFRYLPDIGTHNAEQMDKDSEDSSVYTTLYQTAANIIGTPNSVERSYGVGFDPDNKFNSFVTGDSEEIDESQQDAIRKKQQEENKKFNEQTGLKHRSPEEIRRAAITGAYEAENLPKPMPFPMKLGLTTYGISTLKPGDIFRVDYLPQVYLEKVYFQILNVSHELDSSGWYTSLETQFRIKPEEVDNPIIKNAPIKDYPTEGELELIVDQDKKTGKNITSGEKYGSGTGNSYPKTDIVNIEEDPILKDGGEIDDKNLFRHDKDSFGPATWLSNVEKQTYHVPATAYLHNEGWREVNYVKTYHNGSHFVDSDGFQFPKNGYYTNIMNYMELKDHFLTVWDESFDLPDGHFKNLDFLYKVTLTVPKDYGYAIYVHNPVYLWDVGDNRRNGYGYSPNFNTKNNGGKTDPSYGKTKITTWKYGTVSGFYKHGEQVWFGGKLNTGKNGEANGETHWFVAPCGTYDERPEVLEHKNPPNYQDRVHYGDGSLGLSKAELLRLYDRYSGQSYDYEWNFKTRGEGARNKAEYETGPVAE